MALEHQLRGSRTRVPELDTAILRTRQNPVGIRSKCNREHEVPVSLKRLDTFATLWRSVLTRSRRAELPHLDCTVETATDEILSIRREGN